MQKSFRILGELKGNNGCYKIKGGRCGDLGGAPQGLLSKEQLKLGSPTEGRRGAPEASGLEEDTASDGSKQPRYAARRLCDLYTWDQSRCHHVPASLSWECPGTQHRTYQAPFLPSRQGFLLGEHVVFE